MSKYVLADVAKGRGPETALMDPEVIYLVGIDGDDPPTHPCFDPGAVTYLRPLVQRPELLFTDAYEVMRDRMVTLARFGFEVPAVLRRAAERPHGVEAVAGRHRSVAGRLLNRILDGALTVPEPYSRAIAEAMAEARLPPTHRFYLPCTQSRADDLGVRAQMHRENLMRRVLAPQERFALIAAEVRSGDAMGGAVLSLIARQFGVSLSEVSQVARIVRHGEQAVIEGVEKGALRPSVALQIVELPTGQSEALAAMRESGDASAAAASAVVEAVIRGQGVREAARRVAQERSDEKRSRREGLSAREVRDLLEAAKGAGASTFAKALRLVVEGPDALSLDEAKAFGISAALEQIRRARG